MERSVAKSLILRVEADRAGATTEDFLAVEEPLEIQLGYERNGWRVEKSVSVTMRTPGCDAELAAGFLFTEGIIGDAAQIERVQFPAANVTRVDLKAGVRVDLRRLERHFYTSSSCGVCGKTSIAALNLAGKSPALRAGPVFAAATVHALPETLRETQAVFAQTGGLHAAALFTASGELVDVREDVGRHNAVDKLIGAQLLAGTSHLFAERLLLVSGRASFELVQKALAAGIPILAAVGAPSSLAVALAQTHGMSLLGFVRQRRFNVYAVESRIRTAAGNDSAGVPPRIEPLAMAALSSG